MTKTAKKCVIKSFLRYVWYLFPIIVIFASLVYFNFMYSEYKRSIIRTISTEQIRISSKVLNELELVDKMKNEATRIEVENYLISVIESIDADVGVIARVYDVDGKLISSSKCSESGLNSPVNINITTLNEWEQMRRTDQGRLSIYIDNEELELSWFAYPKENTRYYIVIGVSPDRMNYMFNLNRFGYGLLGMILVMLICTYYNLYLIYELKHCKDKQHAEYD